MDNLHTRSKTNLKRVHLNKHPSDSGFFQEIIRSKDMRQVSHSFVKKGTIKKGHLHKIQTDWWYVVSGELKVFLTTKDGWEIEILLGNELLQIPPGVAHGYEALTDVNLIYICSEIYNKEDDLRWPK